MWAVVVEVGAPERHQIASMARAVERVLIQEFIAHAPVEALHKALLHGLAGGDLGPCELAVLLPFQDRVRGQFGPIVRDHHAGIAPHFGDPVQLAGTTDARQRSVDDGRQACPAEVVEHVLNPEPAATGQAVGREIRLQRFQRLRI